MKQIIKRSKKNKFCNNNKDEFFIECSCGCCAVLKFYRYDCTFEGTEEYGMVYYSNSNLLKRDKQGYDLCFDKEQIEELILRLQEMVNVK